MRTPQSQKLSVIQQCIITAAIPKFTGTVKTWTSFWSACEAYIDKKRSMPEIQKLIYLVQSLELELKNLFGGYQIISSKYALVKDVLKRKYRKYRFVKELYDQLVAHKTVDNRSLPKFGTKVERILQQLEGSNHPLEVGIYERIIESKILYQTLLRLAERKRTKIDWNVQYLRAFLREITDNITEANHSIEKTHKDYIPRPIKRFDLRPNTTSALPTISTTATAKRTKPREEILPDRSQAPTNHSPKEKHRKVRSFC